MGAQASCPAAYRIFQDRDPKARPLHWQAVLTLDHQGCSQTPRAQTLPRPGQSLLKHAAAPAEHPRPLLSIRFVTSHWVPTSLCTYVGQAKLKAKTARPTPQDCTRQVRETCRPGGGRLRQHQSLFAQPRKEEINIDTEFSDSLGKPALNLRLQPWPRSPSPACPLGVCCMGCPACSQDTPACKLQDSLPACLPSGWEQKQGPEADASPHPTAG